MPLPALTRRTFLRSSFLAALAPAGSYAASPARSHDYIDGHVHLWSPDTHRYPLAAGFTRKEMVPSSFTPEQLFAHTRPNGVSRVVLVQMNFYGFDNRYLLHAVAQHPGTFSGIAIIDETQPHLRETMKTLKRQGVRSFRLYADQKRTAAWAHSEGMKAMWSHAADLGMAMCLLADPASLPAVQRMCAAYPRTTVVIDHFARIGMKHPARRVEMDRLCALAAFPHTHVKTSAFYALGAKKAPYTDLSPLIHRLRDEFGAKRLLWGSDCPYQVQDGHTYANSIALIRDRLPFLSAEDKSWMLRGTAERLFFS